MLKTLTDNISATRFLIYAALLFIVAIATATWAHDSGSINLLQLLLPPLAIAFLLVGVKRRWPSHFGLAALLSCTFYTGVITNSLLSLLLK